MEDDGFSIFTSDDYIRIFKPITARRFRTMSGSVYSYSNCKSFQWSEISDEISRYVNLLDDSENSEKSIEYVYIVKRESYRRFGSSFHPIRIQISTQSLIDENFDAGKILSFVIGFK